MATRPSAGQTVGYVRVSTVDQNTARQLDGLTVELDKVFEDKCSGKDTNRPGLSALLGYVREGDTIYVHAIDRLARSMTDLFTMVRDLTGRGVTLVFVRNGLTFSGNPSPTDKLLLVVLGGVAEFERDMIRERQREGIELAKKRGVYKGRKPVLTDATLAKLVAQVAAGVPKATVARDAGISRATLYAYLGR